VIQREIENAVARMILANEVRQGQTVVVDYRGDRVVITQQAAAEVPS
jgi:ATP-dependent Clp protease ATP-binding subunit ClpA